jgi:hypothetical protein
MRSEQNIKKFGHVAKSRKEMINYINKISGTADDLLEPSESIEVTFSEKQTSGNPEEVKVPKKPYKSKKTWLSNNKNIYIPIVITSIIIPLLSWMIFNIIDYGREISGLNIQQGNTKEDVDSLQKKYEKINDKTIKNETILDQLRDNFKDLEELIDNLIK